MTLPASGAISLLNLQTELGGAAPISISEYYGAAVNISTNNKVPASGTLALSNFYNCREVVASKLLQSGAIYSPSGTAGTFCGYPGDTLPVFNVFTEGSANTSGTLIAAGRSLSWYMNAYVDYGFQLWVAINGGSWALAAALYEGGYAQNWINGNGTYALNLPVGSYARFAYSAGCSFQNYISPGYIDLTFNGD